MAEEKLCQECTEKSGCRQIYHQMGNSKEPSIALKVVNAFLLPLVVFIVALATLEKVFAEIADTKEVVATISCAAAMVLTLGLILAIKVIGKKITKNN